jgi:hypothetical protein
MRNFRWSMPFLASLFCVAAPCLAGSIPTAAASLTTTAAIEKVWNSDRVAGMVGLLLLRTDECAFELERMRAIQEVADLKMNVFNSTVKQRQEEAAEAIFRDRSIFGDCALVQISTFYNHEAEADEVGCHIIERGKRMLPVIQYGLAHPIYVDKVVKNQRPQNMGTEILDGCLTYIRTHKVFPKCEL